MTRQRKYHNQTSKLLPRKTERYVYTFLIQNFLFSQRKEPQILSSFIFSLEREKVRRLVAIEDFFFLESHTKDEQK